LGITLLLAWVMEEKSNYYNHVVEFFVTIKT